MANIIEIIVRATTQGEGKIKGMGKDFKSLDLSTASLSKGLAAATTKMIGMVGGLYGLQAAVRKSITMFASFDDTMRAVKAISGATGQEFVKMTELAKEMGEKTRFTAQESASALKMLSMAGLEASEAMEALPHTLSLSASSGTDLARSTQILTQVMAGYGITADELAKVNDVLVATFTSTNTNLDELGNGFTYVGPIAKSLGIEIEETAASLGILANAGYRSEKGGAALRNIMLALIAPTANAGKLFKKLGVDTKEMGIDMAGSASALKSLGVNIKDSEGKMKPFSQILEDLKNGLAKIPDEADRAGALAQIFGKRAGPAMAALLQQGSEAVLNLTNEIKASGGIATKVADEMEAGLGGALRRLKSMAESVGIQFAGDFSPALIEAIDGSREFLQLLKETAIIQLSGLVSDVLSIASGFKDIKGSGEGISTTMKTISTIIAGLRGAVTTIAFGVQQFLNGIALAGTLLAEKVIRPMAKAAALIDKEWADSLTKAANNMSKFTGEVAINMDKLNYKYIQAAGEIKKSILDMYETTKKVKVTYDEIKGKVDNLTKSLEEGKIKKEQYLEVIKAFQTAADKTWKGTAEDIGKINNLLSESEKALSKTSEKAKELEKAFMGTAESAKLTSQELSETGKAAISAFEKITSASDFVANKVQIGFDGVRQTLTTVGEKAAETGEQLKSAFQKGIDSAKTIGDINAITKVLDDSHQKELIGWTDLNTVRDQATTKLADMAAQAITSAGDINTLGEVMTALKDSTVYFGDELELKLIPGLSKLSDQNLSDLKDQLDDLYRKGLVDADHFQIVNEAIANTFSQKLGVAARDFETNVTHAVSSSITQFQELAESVGVTGDVLVEAFSNITGKAQTQEDIEQLRLALNTLAEEGKLSFNEVEVATAALDDQLNEIVATSADGVAAMNQLAQAEDFFRSVVNDATMSEEALENATTNLHEALDTAFEAGVIGAQEFEDSMNAAAEAIEGAEVSLGGIGDGIDDASEALDQMGSMFVVPWRDEVVKAVADIGVSFDDLYDHIVTNFIDKVSPVQSEWVINIKDMEQVMSQFVDHMGKKLEYFYQQLAHVEITGGKGIEMLNNMIDDFELLDEQTTENLRREVEALQERIEEARDVARDFVEDFTDELLRLEGKRAEMQEREYERERQKLLDLLEQTTDDIARQQLQDALNILDEIHRRKMEKILEEEQAKKDSIDRVSDYEDTMLDKVQAPGSDQAPVDTTDIPDSQKNYYDYRKYTFNAPYASIEDWFYGEIVPLMDRLAEERA